jgi:hypothetical protein
MGKKLAIGCLSVFVVLFLAGGIFAYVRFVRPAQQAFAAAKQVAAFQSLDRDVRQGGDYQPPADGVLQADQVERFVAVQAAISGDLQGRVDELDRRYKALHDSGREPGFRELARAWSDLAGLLVEAKRSQVSALNRNGFSLAEYAWVRGQVLRAAGYAVYRVDPSQLASGRGDVPVEEAPVPAANVELVAPHAEELDAAFALSVFGL